MYRDKVYFGVMPRGYDDTMRRGVWRGGFRVFLLQSSSAGYLSGEVVAWAIEIELEEG